MLDGNSRAQSIYDAIAAADPNFAKLSESEKDRLLNNLRAVYAADTNYLKANTVVNPNTMLVPAGVPVATAGSATAQTGSTTSAGSVNGTGTIT